MSFRFNVVRQPVVRTNVVHVTVGVRKLLSGGAKRMNRCVLYCISVFKMSTKPFGAKVRVQSGETVKMHIAQCTNMQVNVENTFKKNQGFSIQYTKC